MREVLVLPAHSLAPQRATFTVTALLVLSALGCDSPNVALGARSALDGSIVDASLLDAGPDARFEADADDDNEEGMNMDMDMDMDEMPIACSSAAQCVDRDEPLCNTVMGLCVECLTDRDCRGDEVCESDGECDKPE